jgi:hypothetical protein
MKSFSFPGRFLVGLAIILTGSEVLSARGPVSEGVGPYSRKITMSSPNANQGLGFCHRFYRGAAIRAFKDAAPLDPIRSLPQ